MKRTPILLGLIMGGVIAAPIVATSPGCSVARAAETSMPRNQTEFDQFAARLDNAASAEQISQLNRAGNAFDNGESRLFWFSDLDAARAQAQRENKPILSLRLLGNLSDELSCANSRLFRVLLYPNAAINRQLRENFVLHWSSERPVPVATIDMGDGRVIRRTLTGNSAHYLLNSDGAPLDVLPGLYAPAQFAAWLQRGADFARDWQTMNADLRPKMLSDWHRGRLIDGIKARVDNAQVISEANQIIAANWLASNKLAPVVTARDISPLALPKSAGEVPILNAMGQMPAVLLLDGIPSVSGLFRARIPIPNPTPFDAATRARIVAMQPENEPRLLIENLQQNVARDTENNRRNFEPAIHAYFINQLSPDFAGKTADFSSDNRTNPYLAGAEVSKLVKPAPFGPQNFTFGARETKPNFVSRESLYFAEGTTPNFDKLNRAVYDKLFRTPASDPWLGLAPADAFVALQNGGVQNAQMSQQRVVQNP